VIGGGGAVSVVACCRTGSGKRQHPPPTDTTGACSEVGAGTRQTYSVVAEVATSVGARTGVWFPERNALYVAAPSACGIQPRLLVFQAQS
jgi:hypothetical protein